MAKKMNDMQRPRTESVSLFLGALWFFRFIVWMVTAVFLLTLDIHGAGIMSLTGSVIHATMRTTEWLYPRQYRTGLEWRAGKPDY